MKCQDYKKFYEDVKIHMSVLVDDEMRVHAGADHSHDLSFQLYRIFDG